MRIGIDFGTATTCVAVVRDLTTLATELISLDNGSPLVESKVWIDHNDNGRPLVKSQSAHERSPLDLFAGAERCFHSYWLERVEAWQDGLKQSKWKRDGRESALMLSYFKPELADEPAPSVEPVAVGERSVYDPLGQSEDLTVYYEDRIVADPAPDTDDMVAATAAILRRAVELAVGNSRAKVDLIVIGTPSIASGVVGKEGRRAKERRDEAVGLAEINRDFGSQEFRVEYLGEAEAASYGLGTSRLDGNEFYSIIIDMGAGTTDFALVRMVRGLSGDYVPDEVPVSGSVRQAGRNINAAIADCLRQDFHSRNAMAAMDRRALQVFMDERIEEVKRTLPKNEDALRIRFADLASHVAGSEHDEMLRGDLSRVSWPVLGLDSPTLVHSFDRHLAEWAKKLGQFLGTCATYTEAEEDMPVRVELVGGGLRFPLARARIAQILQAVGLDHVPVEYRDASDAAQTVVARGLARRAALIG